MKFHPFFLALIALAVSLAQPVNAGSLKFEAEIPKPPESLPLLRLTPQPAPVDLLNRLLAESPTPAKLESLGKNPFFKKNRLRPPKDLIGVVENESVRAWVNRRTGDAAIYPTLGRLEPLTPAAIEALAQRARDVFAMPEFITPDETRFVIDKPNVLNGQTLVRDDSGKVRTEKPKTAYLGYFKAQRLVGDLAVDGPGSRALVALGAKGSVEALTRTWKRAKLLRAVKSGRGNDEVKAEIARQLKPALVNSDVTIDRIELAYYDSNKQFIQPVFRFTARIHHLTMDKTPARTDDDFVIGYVPFAKAFEPLPVLGRSVGPSPKTAKKASKKPGSSGPAAAPGDPIVGRYVVRNDDSGWVNDANAFWNGLQGAWTHSLFANSQYYWAEPRLFTSQKNFFINAMHLALIEVHGDWWLYSTLQNCCDLVNINGDIPSPGYGPSAGGKLADWIIHSCEVVPAPDDTATWPDPWWTVFGGVRNVVGYRTIMYISDGAGGPYGTSLGNVAPVVSSWLSDVMALNAYSGHPKMAAHGGVVRPMGRPTTISMCGHDGDSAFSTSSLGRANCLTVWWFPD
jgi:hypothetical protein